MTHDLQVDILAYRQEPIENAANGGDIQTNIFCWLPGGSDPPTTAPRSTGWWWTLKICGWLLLIYGLNSGLLLATVACRSSWQFSFSVQCAWTTQSCPWVDFV